METINRPSKPTMSNTAPPDRVAVTYGRKGAKPYQIEQNDISTRAATHRSVRIHAPGRITDPKNEWYTHERVTKKVEESALLEENKEILLKFLHAARMGHTIKGRAKKQISPRRCWLFYQELRKLDRFLRKPFDQVTQKEMERFIIALEDGGVKQKNGKPYAKETQVACKKIIIKFYKWLLGDGKRVPDLVDWIDTSLSAKDYFILRKEEVERIVDTINSNSPSLLARNRALLLFLFDSGARADELLNVRIKHLTLEDGNYKARIEFSKTKPRTVALPLCKAALDRWLDTHPGRAEPEAQLFPMNYNALLELVRRAGIMMGVRISPHVLRHSSATYWASRLNRYQLCYRFGWSMSSNMPDRYIDREGLDQEKVVQVQEVESTNALKRENEALNERLAMMEEKLNQLIGPDMAEARKIIEIVKARQET